MLFENSNLQFLSSYKESNTFHFRTKQSQQSYLKTRCHVFLNTLHIFLGNAHCKKAMEVLIVGTAVFFKLKWRFTHNTPFLVL